MGRMEGEKALKRALFMMCMCLHRGVPTGIYETSDVDYCHFVANSCKASIIVVENQEQLDKILEASITITAVCNHMCTCIAKWFLS